MNIRIKNGIVKKNNEPNFKYSYKDYDFIFYGELEYLVDYENIRVLPINDEKIHSILKNYVECLENYNSGLQVITELYGDFVLLLKKNGIVKYIYRCGVENKVYYSSALDSILIDIDLFNVLNELLSYSFSDKEVKNFIRNGYTTPFKTFFKEIEVLKPYSIYSIDNTALKLFTHVFPGYHTLNQQKEINYSKDDFFKALSALIDKESNYSIAYSGGVESRVLAKLYREKIDEYLTMQYKKPYNVYARELELYASKFAANKYDKIFSPILTDFKINTKHERNWKHFVSVNPFISHLALHWYELCNKSKSKKILTGMFGDTIWDFGFHQIKLTKGKNNPFATSGFYLSKKINETIKTILKGNFILAMRRMASWFISRYLYIKSYNKIRLKKILQLNRTYDGKEYNLFRNYPYKLFTFERYLGYCCGQDVAICYASAKNSKKKIIIPYASPLSLHVSSHIKRKNYLDIKKTFRSVDSSLSPHLFESEIFDMRNGDNVDNAPIFKDKFYLKENDLELQIGTVKTFNESKNNVNKYHFKVFIDLMRERL